MDVIAAINEKKLAEVEEENIKAEILPNLWLKLIFA